VEKARKLDRLGRALVFCKPEDGKLALPKRLYFAGKIEKDQFGSLRIEGGLFPTRKKAQTEITGRLKRGQRYFSLVLGEFKGEIEFTNKNRWRGTPVEFSSIVHG